MPVAAYSPDELVLVGSKRRWVPMWLWLRFIFPLSLYEIQPFGWLTYKPKIGILR